MEIILNGQNTSLKSNIDNIAKLVTHYDLSPQKVAIELNKIIIPRENYPLTNLKSGDIIELVEFVGGG
jgi:sulfur carrier protein